MTIAVGILSPGYIVMGADSEESTFAGDLKGSVGKIALYSMQSAGPGVTFPSIAISGAGDSAYLAAIKQQLIEDFESSDSKDPDDFDPVIRTRIVRFYEDHVISFSAYRDLDLRVSLIIAVTANGKEGLWVTSLSTVRRVKMLGLAVTGSGERWVRTVLGPAVPAIDFLWTSVAAAYGVFYAKEYAGGCGKQTQLVFLRRGFPPVFANPQALETLNAAFIRFEGFYKSLRNTLLGLPPYEFSGPEEQLREHKGRVQEIAMGLFPSISEAVNMRAEAASASGSPDGSGDSEQNM